MLLVFVGRNSVGTANRGINGADKGWAIEHDHLVDELHHVTEAGLLILGRAAEVAIWAHAGANRAANKFVFVQFAFYVGRIDVRGIFDGNFDGIESPAFELWKEFGAFVGKG